MPLFSAFSKCFIRFTNCHMLHMICSKKILVFLSLFCYHWPVFRSEPSTSRILLVCFILKILPLQKTFLNNSMFFGLTCPDRILESRFHENLNHGFLIGSLPSIFSDETSLSRSITEVEAIKPTLEFNLDDTLKTDPEISPRLPTPFSKDFTKINISKSTIPY